MIYDDDRFHPTINNDIDTITDKKLNNDVNNGYNKVIKTYIDTCGKKQKYVLEYYSSYKLNGPIINAVTGIKYLNLKNGTKSEDLFFKISINTGENNSINKILFYDTPEQYEVHQHTKLSNKTITQWYEKQKKIELSLQ